MSYIQYMKPGSKFWQNLGDALKYARSTSTLDGGGSYYVTSQAKEDLREQGKEEEAREIEKAEAIGTVGGAILGAAITELPTFIQTMKWLGTPSGKTLLNNVGKDMLVGAAGYLATDEASKAMTGKTVGQQVADGLGKIGLDKVPYSVREGIGNFANPGGWLTFGGGSKFTNYLYNQGKNLVGKGFQYISPYAKSAIIASKLNRQIRNTKLPQSQLNVTELHPHSRVKVGDVEVNDPTMMYRQGHYEILGDFVDKGFVDRSWSPLDGSAAPQFAEGRLWYGLPNKSNRTGLLVTKQSMRPTDAATRENIPFLTTEGLATYVTDNVGRRIPMYDKQLTTSNTDAFVFKPNYGYQRINKSNPKTSLALFERQPAKISDTERLGIPKGERNEIIIDRGGMLDKKFRWIDGKLVPEYTYNPDAPPAFRQVKNWDISDGKPFTDATGKVQYKFRPRRDPEIDYTNIPITNWGDDLKSPLFMREDPTFGWKTPRTAFQREGGLNTEDVKMSKILKNVASNLNVSNDLIKAFDNNVIATRFRQYYWNKGYSLDSNLTQRDIAKIVAENYAQLTNTQSGKLKNLILWNGSPEIQHYNPQTKQFTLLREGAPDQFKIINNGYRTSHSDRPGIYFNTQPTQYDHAIVTSNHNFGSTPLVQAFPHKIAYSVTPGDKQPYLINDVKNVIRGDLPTSLNTTPKNTILHTSQFKGTRNAYTQDPLNGDEFFTTDIGNIKGLFPHPNLFMENSDRTWSMIRSWNNPGLHYKSGGSIKIKKKNEGKFSKVRDYINYKNKYK